VPAPRRLGSLFVVVVLAAAGCALGPRPHLTEEAAALGGAPGTPTGDAGADQVLALLEEVGDGPFTASYQVTRKLGPNVTTAAVVQDGDRRSITVGDIRFLHTDHDVTCTLSTKTCEPGVQDARISDYSIGSTFWAGGPARALRVAMTRRAGAPVASTQNIAGVDAQCVDVPVGAGVEHYCATPAGPIARWDTAAVTVELTGFAGTSDENAFSV
jgi:hypothetical protein